MNGMASTSERPLVGFAFPFAIEGGGVARAQGMDKVAQNVRHLLGTRLGERVMLRDYGGGLHHQPHDIEQALRLYLPEVRITSPLTVQATDSEVMISFDYVAHPDETIRRLALALETR
jgi:phage baseplate assembly protein W